MEVARKPSARVAWVRRRWQEEVAARFAVDHSADREADPFDVLASADPTLRLVYLHWLCRTYVGERFLAEDASRVRDTLVLFDRWKRRLPEAKRDIGRYEDEQSVWEAVASFMEQSHAVEEDDADPGVRERRRREKAKAFAESELYEPDGMHGWVMASPRTHFAAQWWGRGTRWCTTMENAYHFKHYSKLGPLRVFIDPDGAKFQAHVVTGSCADAADRSIDFHAFVDRLPEPAVEVLRLDAAGLLRSIGGTGNSDGPVRNATEDSTFIHTITRTPARIMDPEFVERLKATGAALARTVAETEGGWRLRHVTRDLAKWALGLRSAKSHYQQPSFLVLDVPGRERIDASMDGEGVRALASMAAAVLSAPESFRDTVAIEVASRFEAKQGYRTYAELDAFVRALGPALMPKEGWVIVAKQLAKRPREWFDYRIPAECIDDDVADALACGHSLRPLPADMVTKPRVMSVLARNPGAVATEIPAMGLDHMVDEETAFAIASYGNGSGMEHVPARFLNKAFCRAVLARYPRALKHVPEEHLDLDACLAVMDANGSLVADVPARFRLEREIWLRAARNNPSMLCKVPQKFRDRQLCLDVLENGPDQFPHVQVELPYESYLRGVTLSGSLLARVPLPYRDVEMCVTALRKQPDAATHVPPKVAAAIAADPEHAGLISGWRGKVSSRYPRTDPIFEFEPSDDRPTALKPLPALLPAAPGASFVRITGQQLAA